MGCVVVAREAVKAQVPMRRMVDGMQVAEMVVLLAMVGMKMAAMLVAQAARTVPVKARLVRSFSWAAAMAAAMAAVGMVAMRMTAVGMLVVEMMVVVVAAMAGMRWQQLW
jgi:hypothetical protein